MKFSKKKSQKKLKADYRANNIQDLLKHFSFKPSDLLGQNFLINDDVLDAIVAAAEIKPSDQVLEIGPGIGNLTARLAEKAKFVLAVEKDKRFLPIIQKQLGEHLRFFKQTPKSSTKLEKFSANVELVFEDITYFNFQEHLEPGYKVVANIPYYITGKIIEMLLAAKVRPSKIILLVQKEVAQRIVAKAGDMSILAISVQLYSNPSMAFVVPKEDFHPSPKVDSALLICDVLKKPRVEVDEKKFFRLIKSCFAGKRKQLKNTLRDNLKMSTAQIEQMQKAGVLNFESRPQDLNIDNWYKIYAYLIAKFPDVL
jgi:16S rRNA (adenine1518-N6/adenine1519-N6)-dimethyltransferase